MGTNRAITFSVILFMGLSLVVLAGEKPNFSGTWTLDPERSEMGRGGRGPGSGRFGAGRPGEGARQGRGGPGRRGMGRRGRGGMSGPLTIDHKDQQLVIKQTMNFGGRREDPDIQLHHGRKGVDQPGIRWHVHTLEDPLGRESAGYSNQHGNPHGADGREGGSQPLR